jgi:hypothetical protein
MLCRHILAQFREESLYFYRPEDVKRGSISSVDRNGRPLQFPLASLSIGVVSDQLKCSHSMGEVSTLTAEAKRLAKQSSNNVSHVSPQWSMPAPVSHTPTPAAFHLAGNVGRTIFHFSEEDALAKFK